MGRSPEPDAPWDDDTEDQLKSWDFWYDDDRPVDELDDVAALLMEDRASVARRLLTTPWGRSAPRRVIAQAHAAVGSAR